MADAVYTVTTGVYEALKHAQKRSVSAGRPVLGQPRGRGNREGAGRTAQYGPPLGGVTDVDQLQREDAIRIHDSILIECLCITGKQ